MQISHGEKDLFINALFKVDISGDAPYKKRTTTTIAAAFSWLDRLSTSDDE